ncbi:MAG TPA: MFS transporter [Acidimicrobiales bacterium]|nr:MFS transporter [Acidimicrobiales bacterium]
MAVRGSRPLELGSGELDARRRIAVLAICCSSLFIVGLDNTIVNVALPSIERDLHTTVSGLQWTVDAYTLVLASLLLLAGSMGDRLGRRRTFRTGLLVFALGSLLCSAAPNLECLVAFRMVQAVGGSMLNPVAMSIITNTFTVARERAQAIGVWGAVLGTSMALGPVVGGELVTAIGWRSIFWINVPIAVAAYVGAGRIVPESRAEHARRADPVGQALVVVMLAATVYAIIEVRSAGPLSPRIVVAVLLALFALFALAIYEPRRDEPLIDLRFFRSAPFSGATAIAVLSFGSLGGFLFLNTLYLQQGRGASALAAGIDTLPMAVMVALAAPVSGRIVGTRGSRTPLVAGGAGMTAGCVALTRVTTGTSLAVLFGAYVLFGSGFGLANAPITHTAVSGMPREQAGVAAGISSMSRQVGQSLGVAVVGALAVFPPHARAGAPASGAAGWWVLAGCGAAIVVLGVVTTTAWARRTAVAAARLMPGG